MNRSKASRSNSNFYSLASPTPTTHTQFSINDLELQGALRMGYRELIDADSQQNIIKFDMQGSGQGRTLITIGSTSAQTVLTKNEAAARTVEIEPKAFMVNTMRRN